MSAVKAYYGISLTLADTAAYNLLTLLKAVDTTLAGITQNVGHLSIQADDDNADAAVLIGDSSVATTRYGAKILSHDQVPYTKEAMNVPVGAMYVRAVTAPATIHVEVIP